MNAALVSEQCHCDQNDYDDEHDALFVLGKLENSEQAFHLALRAAVDFCITVCHVQLRFARNDKESCPSFRRVTNRIFKSGFTKAFEPQKAGIALAAGETFGCGIVTTVGERKIDADLDGFPDDIGFRKFD